MVEGSQIALAFSQSIGTGGLPQPKHLQVLCMPMSSTKWLLFGISFTIQAEICLSGKP